MRNSLKAQQPDGAKDHGNSSWLFRAYSAVSAPVVALCSLFYPPAPVIPQPTSHPYKKIPDDIKRLVNAYLDPKDIAGLICSTDQYRLFQPHLDGLKLLRFVVRGEQEKADYLLTIHPELLLKRDTITDYSGRTFKNITAYEYAYWAKDTHMCRMLELHMDAKTATIMHQLCLDIDKNGLTYEQRGVVIEHSRHFDLTPLVWALQNYADGCDNWVASSNWPAMEAAWMAVGMAQRDVPVHVANEYCRSDRSFDPTPEFNEESLLPSNLKFHSHITHRKASWFPLVASASSGLGIDFALIRTARGDDVGRGWARGRVGRWVQDLALVDLAAVTRLNEVRTIDLTQSRENLTSISRALGIGRL